MIVTGNIAAKAVEHPARITLRTKRDGAMIVVSSGDSVSLAVEKNTDFGTNQSAGTGRRHARHFTKLTNRPLVWQAAPRFASR